MTRQKIEEWHWLRARAEQLRKQLIEFDGWIYPKSPDWSGKAKVSSAEPMLDRLVPEMIERQERLRQRLGATEKELKEVETFVELNADIQERVIIEYRARDRLRWQEIAERIGGNNTEDSIKKIYYRFFKKYS